jgi:hypothetical protein
MKNHSKLPYHIDLTKSEPRDLFLSDFAEDVSYVRLESKDALVGELVNLMIGPDRFILNDFKQELLVVSHDGKFMNKIGNKGKGPGEYLYTNNFQVDFENQKYYLIRDDSDENMVFNLNGQFERSFRFLRYSENLRILFVGSNFYVSGSSIPTDTYTPLTIYNASGKKLREYTFPIPPGVENPERSPVGYFSQTLDQKVLIQGVSPDTTYQISETGDLVPYFVFGRGPDPMPQSENFFYNRSYLYKDRDYKAWFLRDLGSIFVMNINLPHSEGSQTYFYNKKNDRLFHIRNFEIREEDKSVGIQNDLDGGPMLIWQFIIHDGYAYCLHQSINLIGLKKSGYFDRLQPKLPDKKKQLLAMIDSLKPDDNPVIMIVKIKDLKNPFPWIP